MFAKNGKSCPMCEYLTKEMAEPLGLKNGWYTETDNKGGLLIPCNHFIDNGMENVLNASISYYEAILRDLKRKRRLTIKAKEMASL